jgi:hypothetical protein
MTLPEDDDASELKTEPKMLSRSRIRCRTETSGPSASTICWAAHAAYGCAVTLMCRTRRRSRERTKKTYKTPKVTVGAVRKSTAIVPTR